MDYLLQPFAQSVRSYIKDTNHFLNKIKRIGKLPEGAILCNTDAFGLYPNIPHREGLASLYEFLETRENKQISSDTLAELAEIVLKIIYLDLMKKHLNKTWNRHWNEVCASLCYSFYG